MRDRTADLLRAKQALSQLSYSPNSRVQVVLFLSLYSLRLQVFQTPKRKKSR